MILKKYIPNTGYSYPIPRIINEKKSYKLIFKFLVIDQNDIKNIYS